MIEAILLSLGAIYTVVQIFFGWYLYKRLNKPTEAPIQLQAPQVNVNFSQIEGLLKEIPNKVLQSIQSSVNTKKGVLGELIGYTELRAQYDRIIPLGNIVDFMCIKFSKKDSDGVNCLGSVDFVDIKTGNRSRLSKDQRDLQKLIKEKRIKFVKVKVETSTDDEDETIGN